MSGKPSFVVYVDESGDEGFSFDRGSSEWFVLSAVVTRKASDLETVKLVDVVRAKLNKRPRKPLHFRDLRHEHRLPFIDEIAKARLRTISVLVHKPSLGEPEKFDQRYRLYFYSVRFLLERVSWLCRDNLRSDDSGDGSAAIVFSNRSGMSYGEMKDYLDRLRANSEAWGVTVHWDAVRTDRISAVTPGKRMGLQIADAEATATFYAVERSRVGFTEDRYVRMLKPVVYHHQGRYLGYGIKFWTREVDGLLDAEDRFGWVRGEFK